MARGDSGALVGVSFPVSWGLGLARLAFSWILGLAFNRILGLPGRGSRASKLAPSAFGFLAVGNCWLNTLIDDVGPNRVTK